MTIKPAGTDKIEGKASKAFSKAPDSFTLISDGSANCYVLAAGI